MRISDWSSDVCSSDLAEGWRIEAVLNNDMIGNIAGLNGVVDTTTARVFAEGTRVTQTPADARARRFTGGEVDSPSRHLARYLHRMPALYVPNLDAMMVYHLARSARDAPNPHYHYLSSPALRGMQTNVNSTRPQPHTH